MYIKRRSKRRIKVWGLIFALLLFTAVQMMTLPCSANIVDGVRNKSEEAGGKVSDMARDAESKVEEIITDVESKAEEIVTDAESKLDDASDGKVEDSDGLIGNESGNASEGNDGTGMSKVGQVSLIVLAVAAIIAVIVIVTVVSRKKKN